MTSEEIIEILESYMPKDEPMNAKDRDAFRLAILSIKVLNMKPRVSPRACHEDKIKALDEIRAEIDALKSPLASYGDWYDGVADCLKIIDKHMAEKSEGKE